MRILLIHNRYRQSGGEDEVFRAEAALLRGAGHSVVEDTRTNDDIVVDGIVARARVASNTVGRVGRRTSCVKQLSVSLLTLRTFTIPSH